jgi:DNA-directed RNA polymerase sigma subunit (sigma70/sigma32)
MQPCEIDKLLSDYRVNKARYDHLYLEAMTMMLQINAEAIRAIANDSIHAQQYNDMPHGSKVSKPVEDLALRYMDGHLPDVLKGWMQESEEMQRELLQLEKSILYVDTWLGALTEKESMVITQHMIDGHTLKELELTSARNFGYHMSAEGIRSIKRSALKKIYEIAR